MPGSRSASREQGQACESKYVAEEMAADERASEDPSMNIGKRRSWPPRPRWEDVEEDEESEVEDEINEADYVWLSMETVFRIKIWDRVDMNPQYFFLKNCFLSRIER